MWPLVGAYVVIGVLKYGLYTSILVSTRVVQDPQDFRILVPELSRSGPAGPGPYFFTGPAPYLYPQKCPGERPLKIGGTQMKNVRVLDNPGLNISGLWIFTHKLLFETLSRSPGVVQGPFRLVPTTQIFCVRVPNSVIGAPIRKVPRQPQVTPFCFRFFKRLRKITFVLWRHFPACRGPKGSGKNDRNVMD